MKNFLYALLALSSFVAVSMDAIRPPDRSYGLYEESCLCAKSPTVTIYAEPSDTSRVVDRVV